MHIFNMDAEETYKSNSVSVDVKFARAVSSELQVERSEKFGLSQTIAKPE